MKNPSSKTTGAAMRAPPVTGTGASKSSGLPMNGPPPDDWALPAIRGVQARHAYYVVLVRRHELPTSWHLSTRRCRPSFGRTGF